jgi:hypothetical protein
VCAVSEKNETRVLAVVLHPQDVKQASGATWCCSTPIRCITNTRKKCLPKSELNAMLAKAKR